MKMHGPPLHTALVQWIRSVLREGLALTEDVTRYMDSAFGTHDVEAVLASAPDSETGPLVELLCFPDREMQHRFESRWGDEAFTAEDQRAIITQISRTPISTVIRSASGVLLGSVEIPAFVLASVVQRLRIPWRPPPQLTRALIRHHPPDRRTAIRVRLRNAGLPWHAEQIRLMELFLAKMPAEPDRFETHLAFLISILSEMTPGTDIRDFLFAKKQFYFKALYRAEDFERRRRSSNMEIMILQGARAAHGDAEAWRVAMRMIDTICRALFAVTPFFPRPGQDCLNVEQSTVKQQIRDVIRILAG